MKPLISPSVLAADFGHLEQDIEMLNNSQADWIHVDVMDGVFVPNISFGFGIMKAIKKVARLPLDVHVMVQEPVRFIREFRKAGADILTLHIEGLNNPGEVLASIRHEGMRPGLVIKPGTDIALLDKYIHFADVVLVMSVEPGFGGQAFINSTYDRIKHLKKIIRQKGLSTLIEVDGGVNLENGKKLLAAGADVLVAGSFVFNSADPIKTIDQMKNLSANNTGA